ncbi:MAG: hypothetical protein AMXMBFR64_23790 [Myxococcales bacterium]
MTARSAILAQWRVAWMTALQYRSNFAAEAVMTLFWLGWTIAPLLFVFNRSGAIAGWTWDEALIVTGFFVTLQGLLEGIVDPNLRAVVEHVRKGTLDFVLLKPHDAQLLVSFSRTVPAKVFHVLGGLALVVWATARLERPPSPADVAIAATLLVTGALALYGLWLMIVSTAFWFVRIDNLSYLLTSVLDAGRWPVSIYQGAVRFVLTFIVPVGIMTTWPALALRGLIDPSAALVAAGTCAAFLLLSRQVWRVALRHYSSASS